MTTSARLKTSAPRIVIRSAAPGPAPTRKTRPRLLFDARAVIHLPREQTSLNELQRFSLPRGRELYHRLWSDDSHTTIGSFVFRELSFRDASDGKEISAHGRGWS